MELLTIATKLASGEPKRRPFLAEKQTQAKFAISAVEARRLMSSKALKRHTLRKTPAILQHTTYYDTPRFLLKKSNITLQVRQTGTHIVQTIQAGRNFTAGALTRWEISRTLEQNEPHLGMVRQVLAGTGISSGALQRLTPVFSTSVRRTRLELAFADTELSLIYDQGHLSHPLSDEAIETISEIKIELKSGSAEKMFILLCRLNEKCDWQQIGVTKAERGYAAISRPHAFRPRKHKEFVSTSSEDAYSVLQNAMSSALAHFFVNNPNLLADKAEAIHQTRVAVRRMRAILHACKSFISYMDRKALNGELRWLQTRLGECRDWHVLRHETLPKMKELAAEQRVEIDRLARKNHAKLLPQALDTCRSRRAQRLILHIQCWLAGLPVQGGPDAANVGRSALKMNIRRLRKLGRLTERKPLSEIHAIRIKSKKLRYTLEILPMSEGADAQALKSLTALQEKLGDLNDLAKCLELSGASRESELSIGTREKIRSSAEKRISKLIPPARVHYNVVLRWNPEIENKSG